MQSIKCNVVTENINSQYLYMVVMRESELIV